MIDEKMKIQLREHFAKLSHSLVLRVWKSDHQAYSELLALLNQVAEISEKINIEWHREESEIIQFDILQDGKPTGIIFRGIPGGHEFSTFVLALLNAGGVGKMPDRGLSQRIQNIQGEVTLHSYVSLSCEICPDVMQTLNQITLLNDHVSHVITDDQYDVWFL